MAILNKMRLFLNLILNPIKNEGILVHIFLGLAVKFLLAGFTAEIIVLFVIIRLKL